MPQIYGKRRNARTNYTSIFTDTPTLEKMNDKLQETFVRRSQSHDVTNDCLSSMGERMRALDVDSTVCSTEDQCLPVSAQSSSRRSRRPALEDFDDNVRRSPRIKLSQEKNKANAHSPGLLDQTLSRASIRKYPINPPSSPSRDAATREAIPPSSPCQTSTPDPFVESLTPSTTADASEVCTPHNLCPVTRSYLQSLLDIASTKPTTFRNWGRQLTPYFGITKIAEASYGEVYRLALRESHPDFNSSDESVLKLIALKPPRSRMSSLTRTQRDRTKAMSAPEAVASEVRLLKHMSTTPGFAQFRDLRIISGAMPAPFVNAWRCYNRNVKKSEFPDPGRRNAYPDDQVWAVVEMQDAGDDLEEKSIPNIFAAWDIFWGVACALAKGEVGCGFEHRDLHTGNICVKWPDSERKGQIWGDWKSKRVGFTGVNVALIDYTLSRADVEERVAYLDLEQDLTLFEADGDDDYQYDIYRYMRSAALHGDPVADVQPPHLSSHRKKTKRDPWQAHHPLTNLVWLHFVLYKLTEQLAEWPSSIPAKRQNSTTKDEYSKALEVESKIHNLWEMLDLEEIKRNWADEGLGSAAGLVGWAVENGWLGEEDVLSGGVQEPENYVIGEGLEEKMERLGIKNDNSSPTRARVRGRPARQGR